MKQAEGWEMRECELSFPVWLWPLKLPKLTAASVSPSIKWECCCLPTLEKQFELSRCKMQDSIRQPQACQRKTQIVGTTSATKYVTGPVPALHV